MKIFGLELFKAQNKGYSLHTSALDKLQKSEFLPDFTTSQNDGNGVLSSRGTVAYFMTEADLALRDEKVRKGKIKGKTPVKKVSKLDKPLNIELTPKGVFELKMLHDNAFKLKTDPKYIDEQIEEFKDRLNLVKVEEYDMSRGLIEIQSVLMRLENRKKYGEYKDFFEQYPYTTSSKISELVGAHNYLKLGKVAQFVPDLPKEAINAMKEYDATTKKICDKKAVYYIVANKKDFEKTEKRRDPILLAQSPFGHFWQILGAWDEEMLLIEQL